MVKPIIGITCDVDLGISSRSISPGIEYYYLCKNYVNAVQKSGGIPVLIPCFPFEKDNFSRSLFLSFIKSCNSSI